MTVVLSKLTRLLSYVVVLAIVCQPLAPLCLAVAPRLITEENNKPAERESEDGELKEAKTAVAPGSERRSRRSQPVHGCVLHLGIDHISASSLRHSPLCPFARSERSCFMGVGAPLRC
jgi:hypothetical protein